MKITFTTILVLFALQVFSQIDSMAVQTLKELRENYSKGKKLSLSTSYALYKDYKTSIPEEKYAGIYIASERSVYMKIGESQVLSDGNYEYLVNHPQKAVQITKRTLKNLFDVDLKKSLEQCKKVERRTEGKDWVCTLYIKPGTSLPYNAFSIRIDQNTGELKKMVLYYSNLVNFSKTYTRSDLSYPRLEIEYTQLDKKKVKIPKVKELLKKKDGKWEGLAALSNYKIYDLTK